MKLFLSFFILVFALQLNAATENLSLTGNFIQGGIVLGKTEPGAKVFFNKEQIRVSAQGDFLIGFSRDEPLEAELKIMLKDQQPINKKLIIDKREYKIQRIDGLPKSKVSPRKPEVLKRIKQEIRLAKQARKRDDDRTDFLEEFIWPVTGPISGVYGSQRILNGQPRRPHFGVDIAMPVGTTVVAPASGIVTLAHEDMFFSGGTIILDHGFGLSSSFLHLSKLLVKSGDRVKQGDPIAEVGATGRVTGAHLDWRMNLFKRRVDPQLLVPPMQQSNASFKH